MAIVVSPTTTTPTHHIKLSDGTTELGFILRAGNRIDPRAISRRPRQNGQFSPFTQSDWSGGRGIKDAQSDRSRYADGKRAITRHNGTVMIGGQETYTTGHRQQEQYMPGDVTWQSLLTSNRYIAYKVTASATGNRAAIYFWIRRRGTPTSTLTVELTQDNSGNPGTVLKTVTVTTSTITDTISQLYEFLFSSVQAVTATTAYWVKIYTSSADSATNYWEVGTDAADTNNLTKASSDGTTWNAAAYDLYFRLVDDTDILGSIFFTYLHQLYKVTRPSGSSAPKLYMNGDRGVATGTHSITTLQDTTKAWTTNQFAGATLLIIDGTGSEFLRPYRVITSNTADTLTFPAMPRAPVSANTVYVILGSNIWTEITGHGLTVLPTSVEVAGDMCHFAQGDTVLSRRMREHLVATLWSRAFGANDFYATFLKSYRDQTRGLMLLKANDKDHSGKPAVSISPISEHGFSKFYFPRLLEDCESTTGWTFAANVTGSADDQVFAAGLKSIKMVVAAGAATLIAYKTLSATNILGYKRIRLWVRTTENLAAGALQLRLSAASNASTSIQDISLPAIASNEWQPVIIKYTDSTATLAAVQSIGIIKTAASGTVWVDGIETFPTDSEVALGSTGEKLTGVELYGDPEVPWIFRTRSVGSIENGTFNPIPLREFGLAENVNNGRGHAVHNVHLYFSFLGGVERFYRNNMDDVGPNRDEGLPTNRRGFATSMWGYIGRLFTVYDNLSTYTSILESGSGTDWHEVYRCDTLGKRIRNIYVQVIPGETADRLWFSEGSDTCWLPLPGNTLKEDTDDTFLHTHEAVLETGWLYGSEQDAVKLFGGVKLFLENATSNRKIEWDYKKNDETTWTAVSSSFTTPPVQEIALNVSARRIKLRFRLQTNDNTETPLIRAMIVNATTRPETRYTYTMNTTFEDQGMDLRGQGDTAQRAETTLAQLDTWMEANTVLTMSSVFTPYHNKTVFLEPVVTNPLTIITDESKEKLVGSLVLIEV